MADATQPIIVDPSRITAQVGTFLRDLGIISGAVTALLGLVKTHDLAAVIAYLQSADAGHAITAAGGILSVAILIWRQWSARKTKNVINTLVEAVPDKVAQFK